MTPPAAESTEKTVPDAWDSACFGERRDLVGEPGRAEEMPEDGTLSSSKAVRAMVRPLEEALLTSAPLFPEQVLLELREGTLRPPLGTSDTAERSSGSPSDPS